MEAVSESSYNIGQVTRIIEERQLSNQDSELYTQLIEVTLRDSDQVVQIPVGTEFQPITATQRLQLGKNLVIGHQEQMGQTEYYVIDVYRLPIINWLFAGFVLLVLLVARWRGLAALIGMALSLAALVFFLIPQILAGRDPFIISLTTAIAIAIFTIYLSHGWGLKSHLSLGSLVVTLLAVTMLSSVSVQVAQLVGLGSEEAYFLQVGGAHNINVQGLLLGGIILGALGVLDDIIVSQVSVVGQLKEANKKISTAELYSRALEVGKDHVASLVNTLVLAYAGANLPLFLLFYTNQTAPIWVNLNSEMIMEEIVRTLVGSIGLVLAVPLTTAVTAIALNRTKSHAFSHSDTHSH